MQYPFLHREFVSNNSLLRFVDWSGLRSDSLIFALYIFRRESNLIIFENLNGIKVRNYLIKQD